MQRIQLTPYRIRRLPAVVTLTALILAVSCQHASAQEAQHTPTSPVSLASVKVADLEDTFWICDWSATVSRLGAAQINACTSATEELKARKFDGDFDRLITWWQKNKAVEHQRLNAMYVVKLPR
jgi:hypothetical protein